MADEVRLRRNVYNLAVWDDTIVWYARAINEMQKRALEDPLGWRYQAAIHDFDPRVRNRHWRQCQHGSWFFLPWHRMYLACFEQVVAAAIATLGGPADWALPFWDYSDAANADARKLPPAFRASKLPDGSRNPLRIDERGSGANSGAVIAEDWDVDLADALDELRFVGANVGPPGFGGPPTRFHHNSGTAGMLERVPHGSMHGAVGGWMGRFDTAGLDPVFWLHHANIDRLWSVWRKQSPPRLDPTEADWLNMAFDFHDGAGNPVQMTCAQVVDTEAKPLTYRYEGVPTLEVRPSVESVAIAMEPPMPEMVGATRQPIVLEGQPTETSVSIRPPTGPARVAAESLGRAPDLYLNFENITGESTSTGYAVYLNLPPKADPREHEELFVGLLPMFGVTEASRADADRPGSGLTYSLNAGKVIQRLQNRPGWNPDDLRITFVPRSQGDAPRVAVEAMQAPIRVGRVSVYAE